MSTTVEYIQFVPGLKGHLIELTKEEKLISLACHREDFKKGDTFEMTGNVMKAFGQGEFFAEAFIDNPENKFWIPFKFNSFGITPHRFIDKHDCELPPKAFDFARPVTKTCPQCNGKNGNHAAMCEYRWRK